jgi:GTPase SAR1 family protein
LRDSVAVIILYDVNNRKSFESIEEIISFVNVTIPVNCQSTVIVGNKIDLGTEMREVSKEEVQLLQKKILLDFFECSSKLNENIKGPIYSLMKGYFNLKQTKKKNCALM